MFDLDKDVTYSTKSVSLVS